MARSPVYGPTEIARLLAADLPAWHLIEGALGRTYRTYGWKGTLMVVNAIGHLAEAAWHHPDLAVSYNSVAVRLHSHDAGGVTDRDFALARKIEEVVGWQPGKEGGPLQGTPSDPASRYIAYD